MNEYPRNPVKFAKTLSPLFLCLLLLLLALGFWQLNRADEKQIFLNKQARAAKEMIHLLPSSEDNADFLNYKKVIMAGRYDVKHQFLLDNRISDGKAGYFVLTPYILEKSNKAVLVNRGWIPLGKSRSIMPDLQFNNTHGVVKGRINRFPSPGIKLPGAEIPAQGWPSVIQMVDREILQKRLGYFLFNFQIELDKESSDGFKREWQTRKIMQPAQHIAYAVQWFGLALTLTILYFRYSIKKNK